MEANDKRQKQRVPVALRIKLRYRKLDTFISKFATNISSGGMFISSRTPKEPGTYLRFELRLADDSKVITGRGVVKWVRPPDPAHPKDVHGMGIEFLSLNEDSRALIERIVEHRRRQGLGDSSDIPYAGESEEAYTTDDAGPNGDDDEVAESDFDRSAAAIDSFDLDGVDVEGVLALARSLIDTRRTDEELAELSRVSAAPVAQSVEEASAGLTSILGGPAVAARKRGKVASSKGALEPGSASQPRPSRRNAPVQEGDTITTGESIKVARSVSEPALVAVSLVREPPAMPRALPLEPPEPVGKDDSHAIPELIHDRDLISEAERDELNETALEVVSKADDAHAIPEPIDIPRFEPPLPDDSLDRDDSLPSTSEFDDAIDTALTNLDDLLGLVAQTVHPFDELPIIENTGVSDIGDDSPSPHAIEVEITDSSFVEEIDLAERSLPERLDVEALAPDDLDGIADLSRPGDVELDLASFADVPTTSSGQNPLLLENMQDEADAIGLETDAAPSSEESFDADATVVGGPDSDSSDAGAEKKGLLRRFFRKG